MRVGLLACMQEVVSGVLAAVAILIFSGLVANLVVVEVGAHCKYALR
jgi:hypothetical protein